MRLPPDPIYADSSNSKQVGAPAFLWLLVGVMALIEIVLSASDSGLIGATEWRLVAYKHGAFWQPLFSGAVAQIFPGQTVSMFVTHAFLHGGLTHLLLNCVILLALGKTVSEKVGPGKTLMILLASAIAGAAVFGFISSSNAPMIGASGAVFGLLGVWQIWDYQLRRRMGAPIQPFLGSILALVLANVLIFLLLAGGLAWEAHLGGWIAGALAAATFARK